ncbi:hypothetical protein KSC_014720 [Ktedonobacter sp. SOSP1-52]|uniref:hypothetical protein n=1 Tax=Ktedonobacter sp. SOSP1-52 TaxID=2778366 RepID=UPI0019157B98|nr:hypothetical protein [Ktedonobacter sp. SOSP1-52]GHO62580.1 hypothetical protein KSC_014720 [Ktedonobacter sp. SOSP1-52]
MGMGNVRYTVKAEHVAENKANISRVMAELRSLGRTDIKYSVFVEDDGKTFNHWALFASEEAQKVFVNLESFKAFQQASRQEGFRETPPIATDLTLVASSYNLFS